MTPRGEAALFGTVWRKPRNSTGLDPPCGSARPALLPCFDGGGEGRASFTGSSRFTFRRRNLSHRLTSRVRVQCVCVCVRV